MSQIKSIRNQIKLLIDLAYSQVGYKEEPKNSNKTKYGEAYGYNGVLWCVIFLWWLFNELNLNYLFYGGNKVASCTLLKDYYNKINRWITNNNYKPGDIAIMTFSKKREIQHCGLIVEKIDDKHYRTIEGNTSSGKVGSQDNGGCVALKIRSINNILGVVRPEYDIIDEDDEDMTDEKFAELMETYLSNLAKQDAPKWSKEELQEAMDLGITDGTRPLQLVPRYQAAIMALRAYKLKK